MFYVVKKGKKPGIYSTWAECEKQIKGFSGTVFKKFKSSEIDEVKFFLNTNTNMYHINDIELNTNKIIAYVDGSFNKNTNTVGYGIVFVKGEKILLKYMGKFSHNPMNKSRNVLGELAGALKAAEIALSKGHKEVYIVHDYIGISAWATNQWKANKKLTQVYQKRIQEYMKKIKIQFIKVKAHSGESKFNDLADSLSKKSVGL